MTNEEHEALKRAIIEQDRRHDVDTAALYHDIGRRERERDEWRAKYEALESSRATCCMQTENERDELRAEVERVTRERDARPTATEACLLATRTRQAIERADLADKALAEAQALNAELRAELRKLAAIIFRSDTTHPTVRGILRVVDEDMCRRAYGAAFNAWQSWRDAGRPGLADAEVEEPARCEVCDWPLADPIENGCVPGNCSYRPPEGTLDYVRIVQRRAELRVRDEAHDDYAEPGIDPAAQRLVDGCVNSKLDYEARVTAWRRRTNDRVLTGGCVTPKVIMQFIDAIDERVRIERGGR